MMEQGKYTSRHTATRPGRCCKQDLIPSPGDEVSIAGSLRIREDYAAMTLNSPEHLTLHRPAPAALKSSAITLLDEGRRVALQGEITCPLRPLHRV